jgi:predicted small lipoprotein YifL
MKVERLKTFLLVGFGAVVAAGCGQKGALVLPDSKTQSEVTTRAPAAARPAKEEPKEKPKPAAPIAN